MEKKSLAVAIAIVAKGDTVVRSSIRLDSCVDSGKIVVDKITVNEGLPYEVRILGGFVKVGRELIKASLNAAVFLPEIVAPRVWQAQKFLRRHNAIELMTPVWMRESKFKEDYAKAIGETLAMLRSARNKGIIIIPKMISELRWVNLEGHVEELLGLRIPLHEGKNDEYGIRVKGNARFHGEVLITLRKNYKGEEFVAGEIIKNSLTDKAKSFLEKTDKALGEAFNSLPKTILNSDEFAANF